MVVAVDRLLARGTAWALVEYVGSQGLRLASNLILWRLLRPDAFGLMAIVNVFFVGLTMFSDIGIGQSIVQSKRGDDPAYLNTVWTIQALRGLALATIACVAAVPIARFYGQPALAGLIPVVALSAGIGGIVSTRLYTASRRIALERLTLIELTSQFAGLAVMVAWAYHTHSVWALAVGGVASAVLRVLLSHTILPGTANRLYWDKDAAKAVSRFGRWIFVSSLLTFLATSSDRLIFGKVITMSQLGVYSIAQVWATIPGFVFGRIVGAVLFPLLSRAHNEGLDGAATFARTKAPILFAGAFMVACLVAGGPTLIRMLYDQRAADAGFIVQALAVGGWFGMLESVNTSMMLSLGLPQWIAAGNFVKLASMVVLMAIGAKLHGFAGAVVGFSLSEVFRYLVSAVAVRRAKMGDARLEAALGALIAVTSAVGLATRHLYAEGHVHALHQRADAFLEGFAVFLVLAALWALAYAFFRRRTSDGLSAGAVTSASARIAPEARLLP
jgi:O-antigen/teichoic acid export membrane protein